MLRTLALLTLTLGLTAAAVTPDEVQAAELEMVPRTQLFLNAQSPIGDSPFYLSGWFVLPATNLGADMSVDTILYAGAGYYALEGVGDLGHDLRLELYAGSYVTSDSWGPSASFWAWYLNNYIQAVAMIDVPVTAPADFYYWGMVLSNTGALNGGAMFERDAVGPCLAILWFDDAGIPKFEFDLAYQIGYGALEGVGMPTAVVTSYF